MKERDPSPRVRHPATRRAESLLIWHGVVIAAVLYAGSRVFASAEEAALSREFGPLWDDYTRTLEVRWL